MPLYPSRHPYGMTAGEVQVAGSVLLLGIRQWMQARQAAWETGAPASLWIAIMRLAELRHDRTAALCCAEPEVADGVAGGPDHLAAKVFRDALLSAQSGELVLGPPDGPGELLSRARLFLSGCEPPAPDEDHAPAIGSAY